MEIVLAAVIALSGTIYSARQSVKARRSSSEATSILRGNGKGDVSTMLEDLIEWKDVMNAWTRSHEELDSLRFSHLDQRWSDIAGRLDGPGSPSQA